MPCLAQPLARRLSTQRVLVASRTASVSDRDGSVGGHHRPSEHPNRTSQSPVTRATPFIYGREGSTPPGLGGSSIPGSRNEELRSCNSSLVHVTRPPVPRSGAFRSPSRKRRLATNEKACRTISRFLSPLAGRQSFVWAAHYWTALATYPEVERNGPFLLPYLVLLRMGFALPAGLLRPRCALTAPFHPYQPHKAAGGIFSVALSVKSALSEPSRPLAGMLPCGDRTFLPAVPDLPTRSTRRLPIRQARTDCRTSSGIFLEIQVCNYESYAQVTSGVFARLV